MFAAYRLAMFYRGVVIYMESPIHPAPRAVIIAQILSNSCMYVRTWAELLFGLPSCSVPGCDHV